MSGKPRRTGSRRILVPAVVIGVAMAAILLLTVTAWYLVQSGQRAKRAAEATTSNLVSVFDRHGARMIDSLQIVTTTIARQLGADPSDRARRSVADIWLADVSRALPHLHSAVLADRRTGETLYQFVRAREGGAALETAFADLARSGASSPFKVGDPVFDENSAGWLLPLAWSVTPREGGGDMVVILALALAQLQELYESIAIGENGSVVLMRDDGVILARRPYDAARIGQNVASGQLFREHLPRRDSGTYRTLSAIDGVDRIISYRRLDATPLVVIVSMSMADVLARWREELSSDVLIAVSCIALLIGLGLALIRIARARDRADAQLRMTLDHMEQGLLMVGPDQRTEVYNRRALELLNLPEPLMARRPLPAEVFAHQIASGEFADLSSEARAAIVTGVLAEAPASYERTRPNGAVLEIRTTPLPDGGAVRTYRDITEQRRAIDDMNASMAFANTLINSSPDCIQLLDREGNVTFISDLGQELFDIADLEAVLGRPFAQFFPVEHRARVDLALRRVRDGQTDRFSRMCPTMGGIPKWWEFIITPVHEVGREPERLFVVARDISARQAHAEELSRAKEAAERASQAKTQFLASMSHEIRTPLNAILGFASLARRRQGHDPELTRQIGLIEKAGASLLTIINDVLDLAKIEAGKLELELRPLDLRNLAEDCLSLTRGLADEKGLSLHCAFAADLPARVVADEARVRQVLLNLLNNAMKFTPEGSVSLAIGRCADGNRLDLSVSDTGIGISRDRIGHLFQDFVQGDGSISRHYGGTGLGLSISRRLVRLMGGEIDASSTLGEGSVFRFRIPLVEAAAEGQERAAGAGADTARTAFAPRRILLVDDLAINLEIVGEMLRAAGHHVDLASSGPQAISAYLAGRQDLILMDVQMPDMDGIQTTRHIREIDEAAKHVPIVALTANVFAQQIAIYRDAGMDGHLGKPFAREALLATVARWSDRSPEAVPQPPGEPAVAVVDEACQAELAALIGSDKVDELFARLAGDLRSRFRSSEWRTLKADAHAIASAAGLLGFSGLSIAAQRLEQAIDRDRGVTAALEILMGHQVEALGILSSKGRGATKPDLERSVY